MIPCILHEDEHLLVVNKPAGLNTHAASLHGGEGIYDWLRNREPRWGSLSIIHRLDKDTSGVMVFGKTPLANRALTDQFTARQTRKRYLLLTRGIRPPEPFTARSFIIRAGEKYVSRPGPPGEPAETFFTPAHDSPLISRSTGLHAWWAEPRTGRTHQIRLHAAANGLPIEGDPLYGSAPGISSPQPGRLCLHATELHLTHPATGFPVCYSAPADFTGSRHPLLRTALIDPAETDAFRLLHGAADDRPGLYVDHLGDFLLTQSEEPLPPELGRQLMQQPGIRGLYHKTLLRRVRQTPMQQTCPVHVVGEPAPEKFSIRENALQFELSFGEGYSVGLFLDQRDNRRRLLTGWVGPSFPALELAGKQVLNTFSYTCGFSVCGARAGAVTTSLDLSKKYLEWGRRNFALNGIPTEGHDFIFGDVFDWLRRFQKRQRQFDVVLLDPPTFSQSREAGVFQARNDYGRLLTAALGVLREGGLIFASNNTADWEPVSFLETLRLACGQAGRRIRHEHYAPQPPDFPVSRGEPAHLKTVWLRLAN